MACSVPHTYDEIKAMVEKQIEEDKARQLAVMNLAIEYDNACGAKDDLRKAYEECNHIPQETRVLIDTFLKEGSNKDYEMHNSLFGKAAKIEKQMNAKLVWLREKYNYHSQTHIGGSSSQTREICDVYLTKKELHQLHLDEKVLRERLEEEVRDEKEREEKIRQKQADDEEFFMEFETLEEEARAQKEFDEINKSLDIDDSNLQLTQYPVRIIPGPAGLVQATNLNNENDQWEHPFLRLALVLRPFSNTLVQTPPQPKGQLGISCSPNALGDLIVTMKDLSGTIPGTIHHKVIGEGGYENDITVRAALILANVSVFLPKPSMHYLNITKKNVVKVSVRIRFLEVAVVKSTAADDILSPSGLRVISKTMSQLHFLKMANVTARDNESPRLRLLFWYAFLRNSFTKPWPLTSSVNSLQIRSYGRNCGL
ncbi:transposase, MuDR, MULE transposase domain protein [Tanacetum coccineum]